jgi:SpoVK/Ycf46/Vps4 family AAA+-type ATPase
MNLSKAQILYKDGLQFDNTYLEHNSYYLALHNSIPDINFFSPLDGGKALAAFRQEFADLILHTHTRQWYRQNRKRYETDRTVLQLSGRFTIEFGEDFCEMLHDGTRPELIARITALIQRFRERRKKERQEIRLIVKGYDGLELKGVEIKRTKLDLDLYYEDDFQAVDQTIRQRLSRKNDKGIVLLHGLPGTGKTTYLRHLVSRLRKQVLFLSPNVAGDLMDPAFIQLLIDNPNSVLIIEDAENILMDRRSGSSSSVSNLLNISDGLLADFLNVQIICTFNSPLTMVDEALMRKGRLIARYEFGRLSAEKAQRLSTFCGHDTLVTRPMTVAEITHGKEADYAPARRPAIGFRSAMLNN